MGTTTEKALLPTAPQMAEGGLCETLIETVDTFSNNEDEKLASLKMIAGIHPRKQIINQSLDSTQKVTCIALQKASSLVFSTLLLLKSSHLPVNARQSPAFSHCPHHHCLLQQLHIACKCLLKKPQQSRTCRDQVS